MPSILCLVLIWAVVSVAARLVLSAKPSADATLELLNNRPASGENAEAREAWTTSIASTISQLDLDSRHVVLLNPGFRSAFLEMSAEEQSRFLKVIELRGMPDFIEGTKRWSRGRYERLTQPALADLEGLKSGSSAQFEAMLADPKPDAIAQVGIEAFLKQTDPLSRLETLPWIERMQKYSQQGR
jgi:hypothetical protein